MALAALLVLLSTGLACSGDGGGATSGPLPQIDWTIGGRKRSEGLQKGRRVPPELAQRPRFSRRPKPPGLRCNPDGVLAEWRQVKDLKWLEDAAVVPGAKHYRGPKDLSAKLAIVSYSGGLSLAVITSDDVHLPAKAPGSFGQTDGVEVELWPLGPAGDEASKNPAIGVHFWLGSFKQLVRFDRPDETWRQAATHAFGAEIGQGWQVEARLPLSALTPLPVPKVERLRYRVTVHDADKAGEAEPTLRFSGELSLSPALEVPEGVQRRLSTRICMADLPSRALWGFQRGWRCSIPYRPWRQTSDDRVVPADVRFSHSRMPEPPKLRYLKERLLLINHPGLGRGVAGLVSEDKELLSLLDLGIVGAADPGNPLTRSSDAEPLRLPDGTWAVAVTHAYPTRPARAAGAKVPPFGARCVKGHRVYLSIIAAVGAPHSTPDKHIPKPDPPPHLQEVLRILLEDCERSQAFDWSISKDRRTVRVHNSIFPSRPARVYRFEKGTYRLESKAAPSAQVPTKAAGPGSAQGAKARAGQESSP